MIVVVRIIKDLVEKLGLYSQLNGVKKDFADLFPDKYMAE
jgi:hypothetical protein